MRMAKKRQERKALAVGPISPAVTVAGSEGRRDSAGLATRGKAGCPLRIVPRATEGSERFFFADVFQGVVPAATIGSEETRRRKRSLLPDLDGAVLDVLGTALAVGVVRVEAGGSALVVEGDGPAFGVAPADDAGLAVVGLREVSARAPLGVGVGRLGLLKLAARRAERSLDEALDTPAVVGHIRDCARG